MPRSIGVVVSEHIALGWWKGIAWWARWSAIPPDGSGADAIRSHAGGRTGARAGG